MNHETALSKAREIAARVLAPAARQNDKEVGSRPRLLMPSGEPGFLG